MITDQTCSIVLCKPERYQREGFNLDNIRNFYTRAIHTALFATLFSLLLCSAPTTAIAQQNSNPSSSATPFPTPAGLEPAVDFWTKVFGVWSRGQVALHDNEHLGVVYRIVEIPGSVAEGLTSGQRTWVTEQENRLVAELSSVSRKHASGQPLTHDEQKLASAIKYGGGKIQGAAERVRTQRGTRERFLRGLEISGRYDSAFRAIFRARGLPEDLAYLPHVESSFQIGARSSVGAAGMWQFMPATARSYMTVSTTVDERLNPVTAAQAAADYFAGAYRTLGCWPLSVTSYNHGIGSMNKARGRYGNDFARIVRDYDAPTFGFSSRNFYPEFLAVRQIAKAPNKYFPEGVRYQAPLAAKPVTLQHAQYAHDLYRQLGANLTALADLNPGWSDQALKGQRKIPAGVTVWVPAKHYVASNNVPAITTQVRTEPTRNNSSTSSAGNHRVAAGESLWTIARKHGTTVAALSAHNGLSMDSPRLQVGQRLALPGKKTAAVARSKPTAASTTHRVTAGDTPFAIASTYQVALSDLLSANNMHARSVIRPGQKLHIPGTY